MLSGMYQPRVKLAFIQRYCSPLDGWQVCVDIDASEEGRTGNKREKAESINRQIEMQNDAPRVREAFERMGVRVGKRKLWCKSHNLPYIARDADIVAYKGKHCIVAEVEGHSSGQPEQKLYRAIGQMVHTAGNLPCGWRYHLVIVVYGDKVARHLEQSRALAKLHISGLVLDDDARKDKLRFGEFPRLGPAKSAATCGHNAYPV
jgi:hypothetical protein